MKTLLTIILALWCSLCAANPFLVADPYPATGTQPDGASVTVNGGSPLNCTIETVTGGVRPKCDLASITTPGTYTLVLTVTRSAGCTSTANGSTCTAAGSASASPFSYVWRAGTVSPPAARVEP